MVTDISALVEKSKSTDIPLLLKAKEDAKKKVKDDPSVTNLAAFKKASKMLEDALTNRSSQPGEERSLKNVNEVAQYLEEAGRKTSHRQLFRDIKAGKLHREKNGTYLVKEVERYSYTRPVVSIPLEEAGEIADAAEQKLREEIRRLKAVADREEFDLEVKRGLYMPKAEVHQELAARAVVLSTGLKSNFEANIAEVIECAHGDMKKAPSVVALLHEILDLALNEYSRDMEFEVEFVEDGDEN